MVKTKDIMSYDFFATFHLTNKVYFLATAYA